MAEIIDPYAIISDNMMSSDSVPGLGTLDDCGFGLHAGTIFALPDTSYVR